MLFKNTTASYGVISILLHWIMAILVIGLFLSGQYMVELDYYDSWYQLAPWWHKNIGFSVFVLLLIRYVWRLTNVIPEFLINHRGINQWQVLIAKIVHNLFYLLLLIICISGYFISTAKGAGIDIFAWFELPSFIMLTETQADLVAKTHAIAAQLLIFLVALHSLAALKHHFINKDTTLIRMLKINQSKEKQQ